MPKPKRPKRKRPPDLVDRLCKAVEELTAERASRSYDPQWVMVHDVARRLGIDDEQAYRRSPRHWRARGERRLFA